MTSKPSIPHELRQAVEKIISAPIEERKALIAALAYSLGRRVARRKEYLQPVKDALIDAGMQSVNDRIEVESIVSVNISQGVFSASGDPGKPEGRYLPRIIVNGRQQREVVNDAGNILVDISNDIKLFRYGNGLAVVDENSGEPRIEPVDKDRCNALLTRYADWMKDTKKELVHSKPPKNVVSDIISIPPPVPPVTSLVQAPFFAPDGALVEQPGYHAGSHTYLAPNVIVPPVPPTPSVEELQAAMDAIWGVYKEFPIVDNAGISHVFAMVLQPFVRTLIRGATPIYCVFSPAPGTGKTLAAECSTLIAFGRAASPSTLPRGNEEIRKRITAALMSNPNCVFFDNASDKIDSPALAAALTATNWQDRVLQRSKIVSIPNTALWVLTGNHVFLSHELARRAVLIRLDARSERPYEGRSFTIKNLLGYVAENRPKLVWSALVIIQHWVAAGQPIGSMTLGSFESWSHVIGGILETAGFRDFLANRKELYLNANNEDQDWREFLPIWWQTYEGKWVGVRELFPIVVQSDALCGVLGDGRERSAKTRLGKALRGLKDRQIMGYRVEADTDAHSHRAIYRLIEVDAG